MKNSCVLTTDTLLVANKMGAPLENWSLIEISTRNTVLNQIRHKMEDFRRCENLTRKCAIFADIDSEFVNTVCSHLHMYNIDAFRVQAEIFTDLTIMLSKSQTESYREGAEMEYLHQSALLYGYRISKFYAFVYPPLHPLRNLHDIRMGELTLLYSPNKNTSASLKKILRQDWLKNGIRGLERMSGPKYNLAERFKDLI